MRNVKLKLGQSMLYGLSILVLISTGCKERKKEQVQTSYKDKASLFEVKVDSLQTKYKVPGLSVAILVNDSIIYKKGFGYANLNSKIPAKPETNYRIASLTKPISSTILLRMEEDGVLSIQDSIKQYIPGYENYYGQVKDYILKNQPELVTMIENFDFERDDIKIWHHLTHTAEHQPGDSFKYNGFIFGALSRVIELKFEKPFSNILKEQIIEKCEMNNTAPSQAQASVEILKSLAQPYKYLVDKNEFVPSEYPDTGVNASAGIVSNVLDLAKFDIAINNNNLISSKTKEMAWTNQKNNSGEMIPYGLGWYVQERDGVKVVWHYGWQPEAFSGLYLKIPHSGITLLMLANGENLSAPFMEAGYDINVFASPFAEVFFKAFIDQPK